MKFAIINNTKSEATKGAKGICPNCGSELIAKCGDFKVNHWAHKGIRNCDPWWENETEWHRAWKSNFSTDWQEISLRDERTNEKHIADVRTSHNLVIEFQHSQIQSEERTARETFYKNLVWVIDGTRLKKDYPRFLMAKDKFKNTSMPKIYAIEESIDCFHSTWLESTVPVIFDFLGNDIIKKDTQDRKLLYCLFPKSIGVNRILAEITREAFIKSIIQGEWTSRIESMMYRISCSEERRLATDKEYINKILTELNNKRPMSSSLQRELEKALAKIIS